MKNITKEGLDIAAWVSVQPGFSAIESPLILQIIEAAFARAAELSAQDASPKYHSINCLSLQSEDNPPLPCDCGAGPTGLTPQEMETASPKDVEPDTIHEWDSRSALFGKCERCGCSAISLEANGPCKGSSL